jgi:hypothetical protein
VVRRLVRAGRRDAVDALAASFPLPVDDAVALGGAGTSAVALLRRRGFDGAALLGATTARTQAAFTDLDAAVSQAAVAVIEQWRSETATRFATPPTDTWDDTRLEHRFEVGAVTASGEMVLTAREFTGGHLDWYSFDVDPAGAHTPVKAPSAAPPGGPVPDVPSKAQAVTAIPTPVRYSGMPAQRWWAFEEGGVHFGDLAAAPGDLGRLLVADYATVYGNDWYSVPLRIPVGTLAQVQSLTVHDTMGDHLTIAPAAIVDRRAPGPRVFRLYELSGDPSVAAERAPWLLVPPSLSGSVVGPPLERVELVRDEAANLAWGIERLVEGPTGRAVDRLQHWRTAATAGAGSAAGGTPSPPSPDAWRYRLESTAPPFWVPFVPVRAGTGAQVKLRRARMQEWELLDRSLTGPKGELLQRRRPMLVEEEEVPRGGATLERRWQVARWSDGSVHVWLQRSKRLGHGERSSGLRWDTLVDAP